MNAHAASLTTPHRAWLRIEDFQLLVESGAFVDFAKTELIDGEILCMNSQFQRHSYIKNEIGFRIRIALRDSTLLVLTEVAVALPPHDAPEPDVVIFQGPIGTGLVEVLSVALLIEVSEATLAIDLGRKASLYARYNVPEYWVVDIEGRRIVRHWQPTPDGFARRDDTPFGTAIDAATIAGLGIETAGLP